MNSQAALDRLVLNLLALAEATPNLSPEALARLAPLSEELDPSLDSLATVSTRIHFELMDQSAFQSAKEAWDTTLPERHQLDLGPLNDSLSHTTETSLTGIEPLTIMNITEGALKDPQAFASNQHLLEKLAGLVKQSWPRRSKPI